MKEFRKLGLSDITIRVLEAKGFTIPTGIQVKVIPLLLEGKQDIVGQSQTGTGKTASFALPILETINENSATVQAIILTPTRELAIQVAQEIESLKGDRNLMILSVYGGTPLGPQRQKLSQGIDIVVGTPGRVKDLINRNILRLDKAKYAILDEADEMLNMGFIEDIESILQNTPKNKIMLLFSATIPKQVLKIAERYMRKYTFIEIEKTQIITKNVEQIYYDVNAKDRVEAIRRILDMRPDFHGIIFCNTRAGVDTLTQQLTRMNYRAAALHGDITQSQREKILIQFRNKYVRVLVATDVAARGIDVTDLTHVINFSLPQSPEGYVHRIGRTGRAGKTGLAITFVIPSERRKLKYVEKVNNCIIEKQTLPTVEDIIKSKEAHFKMAIKAIIETSKNKPSKYKVIADELLDDYAPKDIVTAILKYSLKNELELTTYKTISNAIALERDNSVRSRQRRNKGRPRQGNFKKRFRNHKNDSRPGRESSPPKKYNKNKKVYKSSSKK